MQVVSVSRSPTTLRQIRARWLALPVLCMSLLLITMDTTVLNVALPTLVKNLHASMVQLQWFVDSYLLVFGGLILVSGSLADRFGRKWVLQAGLAIFIVGSVLSAFARSAGPLIATRAVMGLGGALIMPTTLAIITNVFTNARERATALGIWSGTEGIGIVVGPIVSGLLLAHYWWGSIFLINVPIAGLAMLAGLLLLPNSRDPSAPRPDPLGAILSLAGLALLLLGIIEADSWGWTSPGVVASLAGGLVLLGIFAMVELRSDHPMLQVRLFANRRFSVASAGAALAFFALLGMLFLLTQDLQFLLGYSPLQAGLRLAPLAAPLFAGSAVAPLLERRFGTKATVASGMALITAALAWFRLSTSFQSYTPILYGLLLIGLGIGFMLPPAIDSILGALPLAQSGVGAASNSAMIQVGSALGVAVLGSVEGVDYQSSIHAISFLKILPNSVLSFVNGSVGGALTVARSIGGSLGTSISNAAVSGFLNGSRAADVAAIAVATTATVLVIGLLPSRATRTNSAAASVHNKPHEPGRTSTSNPKPA